MENDRELLEYAANAAGFQVDKRASFMTWRDSQRLALFSPNGGHTLWNPLTDDGDALRLAVKLKIDVYLDENMVETAESRGGFHSETYGNDQYASTRRAIVRAAAEIGKQMNGT